MTQKATRNNQKTKVKIMGTLNLMTDPKGADEFNQLQERYSTFPFENKSQMRKAVRQQIMVLYQKLRAERRLWRRDGTLVT